SRLSLARLVDLAAARTGADVTYEPADLERAVVVLRIAEVMTPEELWQLTNQLLAQNGFTTVRTPGAAGLSVVKLQDAPVLARLEDASEAPSEQLSAGFQMRVIPLLHRDGKNIA